ncbi:TPA: hypothetical protein DCL30_05900 [Candidatus Peribacteria bacterium]|nr:hypothetical protein [Candidatus Peribacteria bacterium]
MYCLFAAPASTCGDGVLDTGEQCDDGTRNGTAESRCSLRCVLTTVQVQPPICGNSKVETNELCDDGNSVSADACSNRCLLGAGLACTDPLQCETGLCLDGLCRKIGGMGDVCKMDIHCESGLCRNGVCAGLGIGEACKTNNQCASGLCRNGVCAGLGIGEACKANNQCASSLCIGGFCQPGESMYATVLPLPAGTPLLTVKPPKTTPSGPAALVVVALGAALGFSVMRRKKRAS